MDIDLSKDQKSALEQLFMWYMQPNTQYITLGGYAGTGKTTLIAIFRKMLNKLNPNLKVAFCSYTGKGANVIKAKLQETSTVFFKDFVGTIHSLIYIPIIDSDMRIVGWQKKDELDFNLLIIDEASMIDQKIWSDLLSYNIQIIATGDHGQLPPIEGRFNLIENPVIRLTQIHRQAENNPIIKLSIYAREEGKIPYGEYAKGVVKYDPENVSINDMMEYHISSIEKGDLILCGYNATRVRLNNYVRSQLGFEDDRPLIGDKVICLRNNHTKKIFNGMTGIIKAIYPDSTASYFAEIYFEETSQYYAGTISANQFNSKEALNYTAKRKDSVQHDLFDFGYALTVHKAQGSQARKVILFEERFSRMDDNDWKKWLYTGVTRAKEELILFGN